MQDLAVIIVNWKVRDLLLDCLRTLPPAMGELSGETVVVDNDSGDGSVEAVREHFSSVRVIANTENVGFSKANNAAIRHTESRYFLLLNPDTLLEPQSLARVVEFMDSCPRAAAATSAVYCPDGAPERYMGGGMSCWKRISLAALDRLIRLVPSPEMRSKLTHRHRNLYKISMSESDRRPRRVRGIEGAFFLARREAVEQVGLLDEEFFFGLELTEWSLRFRRANWDLYIVPEARITHLGGQSAVQMERKELLLWEFKQLYHYKRIEKGATGLRLYHARTLASLTFRRLIRKTDREALQRQAQLFREAYKAELQSEKD